MCKPIPRVITALQFGRSLSGSVYMAHAVLHAGTATRTALRLTALVLLAVSISICLTRLFVCACFTITVNYTEAQRRCVAIQFDQAAKAWEGQQLFVSPVGLRPR